MENNERLLVDTHIFIWWMEKNKKLSARLRGLLSNPNNQVFLSVISIWEMILKQSKKRLSIPKDFEKDIYTSGFSILPLELSHILKSQELPFHHQDPFDRMLIAQAKIEDLILVTDDTKINKYDLKTASQ